MKKLLFLLILAAGAAFAYKKWSESQEYSDVWTRATQDQEFDLR